MDLDIRLQILKDAGQISQQTFESLNKIIRMFDESWDIKLTEENGAMLITHLSVAIERITKNTAIDGIDPEAYSEIKNHCEYEKCKRILKDIEYEACIDISESEETFIMMHLCALLNENDNK